MLFQIDRKDNGKLVQVKDLDSNSAPKELELENYLMASKDENNLLNESIFGEPLLILKNQSRTSTNKRADIVALDRLGNLVIIELKKDQGKLGVEMQALQYLADFSAYKGENFIKKFASDKENDVKAFLGAVDVEDINQHARIILVARSFDSTLFSMGEWLSNNSVAFRCVEYTPFRLDDNDFVSFSIAFDRSNSSVFPLSFSTISRDSGIFWHNIARDNVDWWKYLIERGEIPACFENKPGDRGDVILNSYVNGDRIIVFAKGRGAVGWGIVKGGTYNLLAKGGEKDQFNGECLHRLQVEWKAVTTDFTKAMSASDIRKQFEVYHPVSTSVSINQKKGAQLILALTERFGDYNRERLSVS
jgi:hypothetical protein